MRGFTPDYEMISPQSLSQALQLFADQPGFYKAFAGGTDLMVLFESGKLQQKHFIDLSRISDLKGISENQQEVVIRPLATYSEIQESPLIQSEFPLLVRACQLTGAHAIQNRGTLGGNIANASPAADCPPVLLAYGAEIELQSLSGKRRLLMEDFFKSYKKTALKSDEIISAIILKKSQKWTYQYYRKVGTRAYQSISKVAFAAVFSVNQGKIVDLRMGLGSVADRPICAKDLELNLRGKKILEIFETEIHQIIDSSIRPIDDIRSTRDYRVRVLKNLVMDSLRRIKESPSPQVFLES